MLADDGELRLGRRIPLRFLVEEDDEVFWLIVGRLFLGVDVAVFWLIVGLLPFIRKAGDGAPERLRLTPSVVSC